jgi:hypothetical protein
MGGASRATGSMLIDLRGFNGAEILINRGASGPSHSTANSIYYYLRHANTAGTAQVPVTAADVTFDAIGAANVSGGCLTQSTTGRIYTARTTFRALGLGAYPTGYPAGSVTLALDSEKVGYRGNRRYLRVGYVCSGAAATATGTGYGNTSITVLRGRPQQAPLPGLPLE